MPDCAWLGGGHSFQWCAFNPARALSRHIAGATGVHNGGTKKRWFMRPRSDSFQGTSEGKRASSLKPAVASTHPPHPPILHAVTTRQSYHSSPSVLETPLSK
ncbi:unnamed protein product, partial [Ectocarpus sp. 6 AP-2014]